MTTMTLNTLPQWLTYIESIHATEIDLGLERISKVASMLGINFPNSQIITVAGTNGKGTTCAFIENALLLLNKSVAVYSSPHIKEFNERLRVGGVDISDERLIEAFHRVELARGEISLSYYEFTTLACFCILQDIAPEYIILEVGLGGRLDATNMIDPDIAVITTIDLDHQAFLGDTREKIGVEKAGIFRSGKLAVVGDLDVPVSVRNIIKREQINAKVRNIDFTIERDIESWKYRNSELKTCLEGLCFPFIPLDNVATAITVLLHLEVDVTADFINQVICATKVAGRMEVVQQNPEVILDVGHNPQAARYLASQLEIKPHNRTIAVVAMLADKDIENTLKPLKNFVDQWFVAGLNVPRGANKETMLQALKKQDLEAFGFDNVAEAYKMAINSAEQDDVVIVFGSFFTVSEIKKLLALE